MQTEKSIPKEASIQKEKSGKRSNRNHKKGTNQNKPQKKGAENNNKDRSEPKVNLEKLPGSINALLREFDWCFCMETYWDSYDAIYQLVKKLVKTNQLDKAHSVIYHTQYDIPYEKFPKLDEANQKGSLKILPNKLYDEDYFGPLGFLEPTLGLNNFLNLTDYGFIEKDVQFQGANQQDLVMEAFEELMKNSQIVGIDSESFDKDLNFKMGNMQILQLATSKNCYIFDIHSLKSKGWFKEKVCNQLQKKNVKKIFHGFGGDLNELRRTLRMNLIESDCNNIVDFSEMFKKEDGNQISLTFLCEKFIGRKLCKYNCRSNWGQNYLRSSQMHYAALDAFALLKIYEKYQDIEQKNEQQTFLKENNLIDSDQFKTLQAENAKRKAEKNRLKKLAKADTKTTGNEEEKGQGEKSGDNDDFVLVKEKIVNTKDSKPKEEKLEQKKDSKPKEEKSGQKKEEKRSQKKVKDENIHYVLKKDPIKSNHNSPQVKIVFQDEKSLKEMFLSDTKDEPKKGMLTNDTKNHQEQLKIIKEKYCQELLQKNVVITENSHIEMLHARSTFLSKIELILEQENTLEAQNNDFIIQSTLALTLFENIDVVYKTIVKKLDSLPVQVSKITLEWIMRNITDEFYQI